MSARVIPDRELLHNVRFEVEELRRGMAALVERLERIESTLELDADRHSRRIELEPAEWLGPVGEVAERLRPYFAGAEVGS